MANFPTMNHDDMPLYTKYLRVGQVGYAGKLNPNAQAQLAATPGGEFVQIVKDRRSGGKVYANDLQQIAIYDKAWRGGGGTGSGGAFGGIGGAIQATQSQPALTGGGMGWKQQAVVQQLFAPARADEFKGIDTLTPPEKLAPGLSPYLYNIEQGPKIGSLCKRRGIAKLTMDRDSLTDGGVASATLTCTAKADFVASTDFVLFWLPNDTAYSFWFDKTGADSEPAASIQYGSTRVRVNISADTTATEVAARLVSAINTAAFGLTASNLAGVVTVTTATLGWDWGVTEFVTDTDFTVTGFAVSSGATLSASYRGLSIAVVPSSGDNTDGQLITMCDKFVGETSPALSPALLLCMNYARWGKPVTLKGVPGPLLALTQLSAPVRLVVTATYTNVFDASTQDGVRKNSIVAIVIRYANDGFPRDIDGKSEGPAGTALADRATYTGSTAFSSGTLAVGKWFVTAWALTREGQSEPSFATLTLV